MSPPQFIDATVKVGWVVSRLDELLGIDAAERQADPEGATIREAIQSLKTDIVTSGNLGITFTSGEMTLTRLTSYFGLQIPSRRELMRKELKLDREFSTRPIPPQLGLIPCYFLAARFTTVTGLTCEYQNLVRFEARPAPNDPKGDPTHNPQAPKKARISRELPCRLLPDVDLSVTLVDTKANAQMTITGRADWVFGVSPGDVLSYFGCITVVQSMEFSSAETSLIANLSIIRECHIQGKQPPKSIEGCYTDGVQYAFIFISADNQMRKSRVFEIWRAGELKIIFNFIMSILDEWLRDYARRIGRRDF